MTPRRRYDGVERTPIRAEEPLLFHTGMRSMFPSVSEAISSILPVERLRWITFW
jgi:hypothetical protein